ncbi:MAG: hypothetical protein EOP49_03645 [Sphingobacteriales bacterium]|nr:MAG: hypothetical protein EOP49_03645 [Sphingobacteriales bacterium]
MSNGKLAPIIIWLSFVCLLFSRAENVKAQVVVSDSLTGAQLLDYITGQHVTVSNAVLTCSPAGAGIFTTINSNIGLDSGIILTTGMVATDMGGQWIGADNQQAALASFGANIPGDAQLASVLLSPTYDACRLDFDFISTFDTVLFNYVFSSEEYDDFSCTGYNDAFAFFISGPGISGFQNIALIPGTNIPIAINSTTDLIVTQTTQLTPCTDMGPGSPFSQYYVDNSNGTSISYFGFTTVLEAKAPVTAG